MKQNFVTASLATFIAKIIGQEIVVIPRTPKGSYFLYDPSIDEVLRSRGGDARQRQGIEVSFLRECFQISFICEHSPALLSLLKENLSQKSAYREIRNIFKLKSAVILGWSSKSVAKKTAGKKHYLPLKAENIVALEEELSKNGIKIDRFWADVGVSNLNSDYKNKTGKPSKVVKGGNFSITFDKTFKSPKEAQKYIQVLIPFVKAMYPASESERKYFVPSGHVEFEDEIPTFNKVKGLKNGAILSLITRRKSDRNETCIYKAVLSKLSPNTIVLDYSENGVWTSNRKLGCERGYYQVKYDKDHAIKVSWFPLTTTDDIEKNYTEGSKSVVEVNKYERDPAARAACIARYGHKCVVCNIDFESIYGTIGSGFIHVHHLSPISKRNGRHKVNPSKDLRPVCPNCHSMIHRHDDVGLKTINKLRKLIKT